MRFGKRTRPSQSAYSWGAGAGASLRNLWGTGALDSGKLVNGLGEGNNGGVWEPTLLGTFGDWDQISGGGSFGMGIRGGKLYGWGINLNGRNGQNVANSFTTSVPTQVGTDTDWVVVRAGSVHSMALKGSGQLWGWGNNANGRTAQGGTAGNTLPPTRVGTFADATDLAVGTAVGAMVRDGGKLFTWGFNQSFQTGLNTNSGNTTTPAQVTGFDDWAKVSISGHGLAIRDVNPYTNAGKLYAWGPNGFGRTGQNTVVGNTQVPEQIGTDDDWVLISAGGLTSFATKADGRVFACGTNTFGQQGNNTSSGNTLEFTEVPVGADNTVPVTQIFTPQAGSFTLAVKEGDIYATGQNSSGAMGVPNLNINANTLVFTIADASGDWDQVTGWDNYSLGLKRKRI